MAYFNKGVILSNLGELEEANLTYDEMIEKYGNTDNNVIGELIVEAYYNKDTNLSSLK